MLLLGQVTFCADELTDRPDILELMQPNWTLSRLLIGLRDPRHLLPYSRAVSRIRSVFAFWVSLINLSRVLVSHLSIEGQ